VKSSLVRLTQEMFCLALLNNSLIFQLNRYLELEKNNALKMLEIINQWL